MKPAAWLILRFIVTLLMTALLLWGCLGVFMGPKPEHAFEAAWKVTGMLGGIALYSFILIGMWDGKD